MIRWLYQYFGLVGNVVFFAVFFFLFIFWMAGTAGLIERSKEQKKNISWAGYLMFTLIPPVSILWLFTDMWAQRREFKR